MPQKPGGAGDSRRYGQPVATYRLQLHAGFGFEEARRAVPYLLRLGVSHLYLSPIFAANPGSSHGYDVVDHGRINPELGGIAGLYALGEALLEHDLGCIVDIVPNHVGIGHENARWNDVLRHGEASRSAQYFDIDWEAQPHLPRGIVVLPILGKPFGQALEEGEITIGIDDGLPVVRYGERVLPLSPQTIAELAGLPPLDLGARLSDASLLGRVAAIGESLAASDSETANSLLDELATLIRSEPSLARWLGGRLAQLNGAPGNPASFDQLEAILRAQHYRLAFWRVAGEEINYRRFFDVNGLAGIRVEREDVFEEVHRLLLDLVERGIITGIRVDHIDGLYAPEQYLRRLKSALASAAPDRCTPIYVEKILAHGEVLPHWPISGTTGYEFAAMVDGLQVACSSEGALSEAYSSFIGDSDRFGEISYRARRLVADTSFAGEIAVLAVQLHRLAQRSRIHRDETLSSFRRALRATMANFPVYRTYLDDPAAEAEILAATRAARRREDAATETAFDFVEEVLLLRGDPDPEERERRVHFRRRLQQVSGPIMAKGVEDTAFFRYNRLLSLNEVGADPATFGRSPAEVHDWLHSRACDWPLAMSAGSTHDSKRSADVRARLNVLSEIPGEWRKEVRRWARLNARHKQLLADGPAPEANHEYYLYQSLVGALPDDGVTDDFRSRIEEHFVKAIREAKDRTSWIRIDEEYEAACTSFVRAILGARTAGRFLVRLHSFADRIRAAGCLNALGGVVLRCFAPGVPDVFQGDEAFFLALTDPDNRRPVDFEQLRAMPCCRDRGPIPSRLCSPSSKAWLLGRSLQVREANQSLFARGDYTPVATAGAQAERLFAFRRECDGRCAIVVVPRLAEPLVDRASGQIPGTAWEDTRIAPGVAPSAWTNLLTGEGHEAGEQLLARDLLDQLPFAVLLSE